ncbi:MAG TPA: 4a-hydroxytetrahydrobiopterin dehydratase [Casimicrobiaceae bacterium]|nr:4a-hydroxytetrahydrobiopterin dehydratase [Casimicrobiaceae bacterium]
MTTDFPSLSDAVRALGAQHCRAGAAKLSATDVKSHLTNLPGWSDDAGRLTKTYTFKNFYETTSFVNALAWIANREDHHPDLTVSYNRCVVAWSTHDAGGITQNDVVCAAKTESLFA